MLHVLCIDFSFAQRINSNNYIQTLCRIIKFGDTGNDYNFFYAYLFVLYYTFKYDENSPDIFPKGYFRLFQERIRVGTLHSFYLIILFSCKRYKIYKYIE